MTKEEAKQQIDKEICKLYGLPDKKIEIIEAPL